MCRNRNPLVQVVPPNHLHPLELILKSLEFRYPTPASLIPSNRPSAERATRSNPLRGPNWKCRHSTPAKGCIVWQVYGTALIYWTFCNVNIKSYASIKAFLLGRLDEKVHSGQIPRWSNQGIEIDWHTSKPSGNHFGVSTPQVVALAPPNTRHLKTQQTLSTKILQTRQENPWKTLVTRVMEGETISDTSYWRAGPRQCQGAPHSWKRCGTAMFQGGFCRHC